MKIIRLIALTLLFSQVSAQDLPFSILNFTALPGTVIDTPDYDGPDPRYLRADRPDPLLTKGFNVKMTGSVRTDLDLDAAVYGNKYTTNFSLNFTNAANVSIFKTEEVSYATLKYSFPQSPGMPLSIKVFDMDGEAHSFMKPQGNILTMQMIPDSIDGEIDTIHTAPYLMGVLVKPEGSRTLVRLIFHDLVSVSTPMGAITSNEIHFYIEKSYSLLTGLMVSATNIPSPISVYNHTLLNMPPSVIASPVSNGYAGDELTISGNNFDFLEQVTFGTEEVVYEILDNHTLKLTLPHLLTTAPFMLSSDHGNAVTSAFTISEKPECNAIPSTSALFFYFEEPEVIRMVMKWNYSGNPASTFEVRYKDDPGSPWIVESVSGSNEFSIKEPKSFSTYSFEVRAMCPNGLYSDWSETGVLKIEYTDMIEVSKEMNRALITWMNDSINLLPLDSFLDNFADPLTGPLDTREAAGFVDRFFERETILYGSSTDVATTASLSCICKVVSVDLSQVYEANQDQLFDYGTEHKQKGKYQVGFKYSKFRYIGAAQRNKSGSMDYDTRNSGEQDRRHTETSNVCESAHVNGDTPYVQPKSHALMRMAYLCANPSMVRYFCGCNKKVYISAEIKADVCANVVNAACKGHLKHDYGGRAECGFGGIITTGIDYGDPEKTAKSIEVIAAGHHNVYKHINYSRTWNETFVQKGISLLYNTTLAVLTAGSSDVVANLINKGYMGKAVDDLGTLLTTSPFDVVFEEGGTNGCNSYSVIHPADPFFIFIRPNEERFVSVATVSYSKVRGWGCYYDVIAHMKSSYHLAAVTDRYDFADYPSCCINPTASYATRSIDEDFNQQRGGIGHQDRIKQLLYHHGDKAPVPANPAFSQPTWIDPNGNIASVDNITAKVEIWDASPVINKNLAAGRLSGKFSPCRPEMLHDALIGIGGPGGTSAPVTLKWAPSVSTYRTGYFIEKGYNPATMTLLNAVAIPRDSVRFTDSVDLAYDSVYYRIYAVNDYNNTESEYSTILALPLQGTLAKRSSTALDEQAEDKLAVSLSTYPNPSSGITYLTYSLPGETTVSLAIYDMNGKKVQQLVNNENQERGIYVLPTDLQKLARGQYIVLLRTNGRSAYQYLLKE